MPPERPPPPLYYFNNESYLRSYSNPINNTGVCEGGISPPLAFARIQTSVWKKVLVSLCHCVIVLNDMPMNKHPRALWRPREKTDKPQALL